MRGVFAFPFLGLSTPPFIHGFVLHAAWGQRQESLTHTHTLSPSFRFPLPFSSTQNSSLFCVFLFF